jgi:cation transport ATPase
VGHGFGFSLSPTTPLSLPVSSLSRSLLLISLNLTVSHSLARFLCISWFERAKEEQQRRRKDKKERRKKRVNFRWGTMLCFIVVRVMSARAAAGRKVFRRWADELILSIVVVWCGRLKI